MQRHLKLTLAILVLCAFRLTAEEVKEEEAPNPYLAAANQTLQLAGLPVIPENADKLQCYAWTGLSAGIYATFVLEKADLESYLASFPPGIERASPIPQNLLAAPNSAAPWFTPGDIADGSVLFRGRITRAAPELFRLYLDPENSRVFLYYTWNNKWIYP